RGRRRRVAGEPTNPRRTPEEGMRIDLHTFYQGFSVLTSSNHPVPVLFQLSLVGLDESVGRVLADLKDPLKLGTRDLVPNELDLAKDVLKERLALGLLQKPEHLLPGVLRCDDHVVGEFHLFSSLLSGIARPSKLRASARAFACSSLRPCAIRLNPGRSGLVAGIFIHTEYVSMPLLWTFLS